MQTKAIDNGIDDIRNIDIGIHFQYESFDEIWTSYLAGCGLFRGFYAFLTRYGGL